MPRVWPCCRGTDRCVVWHLQDPRHVAEDVGCGGDNDPLDVCEIGLRQIKTGEVRQVKVLGILCLIDDGEADWKVSEEGGHDNTWAAMHHVGGQAVEPGVLVPGLLGVHRITRAEAAAGNLPARGVWQPRSGSKRAGSSLGPRAVLARTWRGS